MSVKSALKKAAYAVMKSIPPGRVAFLLGHDRSGSTWLGRTIGLASDSLYLHEPLNEHASGLGNWNLYNQYVAEDESNEAMERVFDPAVRGVGVRDLTKGEIVGRVTGRKMVVIKETGGMMNGGWLRRRYGGQVLLLLRHPAPVILSNIRMGKHNAHNWLEKLAGQHRLVEEYCHDVDFLALAGNRDDLIAAFTVVYCVRYRVALAQLARNPDWHLLKYEEFCEDPVGRFRDLYRILGLDFTAGIERAIRDRCSDGGSQAFYGTRRVSRDHATKWQSQMDERNKHKVRRILDAFGFPHYRSTADWQVSAGIAEAVGS